MSYYQALYSFDIKYCRSLISVELILEKIDEDIKLEEHFRSRWYFLLQYTDGYFRYEGEKKICNQLMTNLEILSPYSYIPIFRQHLILTSRNFMLIRCPLSASVAAVACRKFYNKIKGPHTKLPFSW